MAISPDQAEPPCAHLGAPVPDPPYPRSNRTSAFQQERDT